MVRLNYIIIILFFAVITCACSDSGTEAEQENESIVELFGQLSVSGTNIVDKNDDPVALRGMSLFWSQWGGKYYNKETIHWLSNDWRCTIIRAAVGIESGGYLENQLAEISKLYTVIDACIEQGIYIIVDWHDHRAEQHQEAAISFFSNISGKYGNYPNIIYEIYNEPLDVSWNEVLKPYSEAVISAIRANDPDNLIAVGTPNWSQDVEDVIGNRIDDENVVYSLHFYSSTHRQSLRDKASQAIAAEIPLMVTEWGVSESDGAGEIDLLETLRWTDFLEQNNLSWCNWSVINKDETSAALLPSTTALSGWTESELTQSGKMIRDYLITMNESIFNKLD